MSISRHKETVAEFIKGAGREATFTLGIGIVAVASLLAETRDWGAARAAEMNAYRVKRDFEAEAAESGQVASQLPGWKELDDAAQQATRDRLDTEDE